MARYRLSRSARNDLKSIQRYIARDSPDRGAAMVKRIRERCRLLQGWPNQGPVRDDTPIGLDLEVRSVPVGPYIVFYHVLPGNVVFVLRVVDGRRDLETILE